MTSNNINNNDYRDISQKGVLPAGKLPSDFEREIEEEIEQARSELTTVGLAKQKEVIHRMGEALEKIREGEKRHSICEELKNRLREEIARRIISEKTIENYSKPEWKDPQKSMWGKKGATSKNRSSSSLPAEKLSAPLQRREKTQGDYDKSEQDRDQSILVKTNGSIDCTTDLNSNDMAASTISNESSQYENQSEEFAKSSSAQTAESHVSKLKIIIITEYPRVRVLASF